MKKKKEKNTYKRNNRIINIIFSIIVILILMIVVDIISIYKYNNGPYFAIKTKESKIGYKEYYGLGYKVIKYNQVQGRRDTEIGTWRLKANTKPIDLKDIDLSLAIYKNEEKTYKKYYKKFVRVKSTLKEVNEKKHTIKIGYIDEGGKYNLDIICDIIPEQTNITSFEKDKEITVIGTVNNYKGSTKKENKRLYITNCIAQQ